MKLISSIVFITLSIFIFFLNSCKTSYAPINVRKVNNSFVALNEEENIYICKYETSNFEYNTFLKSIKKDNLELWRTCFVDSTKWRVVRYEGKGYWERKYNGHPIFNNYPVVNINRDAAIEYCNWLTEKYNSKWYRKNKKVKFRLPTEKEFRQLIKTITIKYDSDNPEVCSDIGMNMKYLPNDYPRDGGLVIEPAFRYIQNVQGVCSIIGNVAEFTVEGKALGGSWDNFPSEAEKDFSYTSASPRVGFRVVMEVLE